MKKTSNFLLLLLVAVTLGLYSCGAKTPADKFADMFNETADKVSKCNSESEVSDVIDNMSKYAKEFEESDADYVLTASDKETLKKAIDNFIKVVSHKALEFYGVSGSEYEDLMEEQMEAGKKHIYGVIDNAKTLGDLGSMSF